MNTKRSEKEQVNHAPICDVEDLASATECTGLTPAAVQSPEEGETYAELYAIHQLRPSWKYGEKDGKPCRE